MAYRSRYKSKCTYKSATKVRPL